MKCKCYITHGNGDIEEIVQCDLCKAGPQMLDLIKRINYTFYVVGTSKVVKEVISETKGIIRQAEGRVEPTHSQMVGIFKEDK